MSNQGTRQDKQFAFRGKPEYVQILTSSSVEAANLANNHSADYGDVSLSDTIKYLNEAGISNFIGTNTAIRDVNGISVGLVGIDALDETEAAKLENVIGSVKSLGAQLVIVSIHWGEEKATARTIHKQSLHTRRLTQVQTLFWEHTLTFCRVLKNTTVNI